MKTNLSTFSIGLLGLALILIPSVQAADGTPLWTNRFAGATGEGQRCSLALDGSGNVFVTGHSYVESSHGYVTVKYSNSGLPLWTNLFKGTANSGTAPASLAVDSKGDVYVTGSSTAANLRSDIATIKYSSSGFPLWTNLYDGAAGSVDDANDERALALDSSGNVYVVGRSLGGESVSSSDGVIIKYSSAGSPLWTNLFNGPANNWDEFSSVAVATSGDVYVTGVSTPLVGYFDYVTIKYSSAGVPSWTNVFNGVGNGIDLARSLAVNGDGDVFVTGYSLAENGRSDFATIKYSSSGVPLWTNLFNGIANGSDEAASLVLDGGGNVYVTGSSELTNEYRFATIKYSSAGVALWTNFFDGDVDRYTVSVAVDGTSNVYVIGSSVATTNGYSDYTTIKYSSDGVPLWTNHFNGLASLYDYAFSMAVDGSGNVYVTGASGAGGGNYHYVTIKYSGPAPLTPVLLNIVPSGNQVILSWSNAAFNLQSAPQLTGVYTNIPGATSPHTNSVSDARCFFRLISN